MLGGRGTASWKKPRWARRPVNAEHHMERALYKARDALKPPNRPGTQCSAYDLRKAAYLLRSGRLGGVAAKIERAHTDRFACRNSDTKVGR